LEKNRMNRVIQFSKARYYFFAFSLLLFLTGAAGYLINGGFNLGVDFKAGLAQQFQIAPASFSLQYTGGSRLAVTMPTGDQALTAPGDFIVALTDPATGVKQEFAFKFAQYPAISDLMGALASIPGLTVAPIGNVQLPSTALIPPANIVDVAGKSYVFNTLPSAGGDTAVGIADIRETLSPLGKFELQVVGKPADQRFMARVESIASDPNFQDTTKSRINQLLSSRFGTDEVLLLGSNFMEPRMSQALASQSVWLAVIAALLILLYMVFRFRPAIYAVAAVLGVCHDALVILAFNAVFRIEIDAGTIAAILTILGYSINDTIVIFDRVRENNSIMRGSTMRTIMDTSFSQNLGRTFITSGATMLTVLSLFILTTGSMKTFSLNMLVGLIEGTYSTFISVFMALQWLQWSESRKKKREAAKYGAPQARAKDEEPEDEEPEGPAESAAPAGFTPETPVQAAVPEAAAAVTESGEQAAPPEGQQPSKGIVSFPGGQNQGYRYLHKRHKRRRR
jgi:preprotein translocase subunit SecF